MFGDAATTAVSSFVPPPVSGQVMRTGPASQAMTSFAKSIQTALPPVPSSISGSVPSQSAGGVRASPRNLFALAPAMGWPSVERRTGVGKTF